MMASLWVGAPGLPQGQKVMPEPEAGFAHRESIPALPTLRQAVAAQKNPRGLLERTPRRMIDIAVTRVHGHPLFIEGNRGRRQWLVVAGHAKPSRTMMRV